MKFLVVYDSQFGNTELIAKGMADALQQFGEARAVHVSQADPSEFRSADLLILGCPIQAWKPSAAMRSLLEALTPESVKGVKTACFDTRIHLPKWFQGSGGEKIEERLRSLGAALIAPPEGFWVSSKEGPMDPGEEERASNWARAVGKKCWTSLAAAEV